MKAVTLALLLGLSVLISTCAGHGYIHKSRSHLCSSGGGNANKNCGSVQYEPQSVEAVKGFPAQGPIDEHIASGKIDRFHELDAFGSDRWTSVSIQNFTVDTTDGKLILSFPWTLTAPHRTTSFGYFISKKTFNADVPLTRAQLEETPFCVDASFKGEIPPPDYITRNCPFNPTGYSGKHVILGVWSIDDTVNAFYQVIDVEFPTSSAAL